MIKFIHVHLYQPKYWLYTGVVLGLLVTNFNTVIQVLIIITLSEHCRWSTSYIRFRNNSLYKYFVKFSIQHNFAVHQLGATSKLIKWRHRAIMTKYSLTQKFIITYWMLWWDNFIFYSKYPIDGLNHFPGPGLTCKCHLGGRSSADVGS